MFVVGLFFGEKILELRSGGETAALAPGEKRSLGEGGGAGFHEGGSELVRDEVVARLVLVGEAGNGV